MLNMWNRGGYGNKGRNSSRGHPSGRERQRPVFRGSECRRNPGPDYSRNNRQSPGRRLGEVELGITEYVRSEVKGFDGVIKARYSDFQVSEVDVQGKIAKLTDLTVPSPGKTDKTCLSQEDNLGDKCNTDALPMDVWNQLSNMVQSSDNNYPAIEVDVTNITKEDRTKIYDAVSGQFGNKIIGSTKSVENAKFIIFSKLTNSTRIDSRIKWNYPEEFVHFIVHKENLDTMDAAQIIAQGLRMNHIKPSFFGYSGTKDRRAKTSQWFSLRKVDPARISSCAKRLRNIYIGNFEFKNYHLSLGYLKGNVFRIALRNVTENKEIIDNALESFKEHGFLNYYGLQRFGSRADVPTYKIGKHLLRGEFREAIDLILTPQGPYNMQLRCYKETGDASKALLLFPKNANSIEQKLIKGLSLSAKNDLVTALEHLPRNMRLLYIHSFQSWVWNQCVSERIRRHGLHLAVGDLVTEDHGLDYDVSEDYVMGLNEDVEGEQHRQDNKEVDVQQGGKRKQVIKYPKLTTAPLQVREITQQDLTERKYTIYDLVLPLPGYNIVYPSNIKDFYDKIIVDEGVDVNLKQKIKFYNLSGTYRKVVIKPQNVSWKSVSYDEPHCDLIQSDWDELTNKNNVKYCNNGKYKALILQLTLGSSTYATMALRELLKRDTSSETQAQKNDYYKDNSTTKHETSECSQVSISDFSVEGSGEKRKQESDTNKTEDKKLRSLDCVDHSN